MKRTQIQLDEETYERVRRKAFEEDRSMASVIREILRAELGTGESERPGDVSDLSFVGAGASDQGDLEPVSERHDEALAREADGSS